MEQKDYQDKNHNELEMDETVDSNLEATQETTQEQSEAVKADDCEMQYDQLQQEHEALNNKYLRTVADFQNYRKRVEKEKSDIHHYANEKLIQDLLPVVDNLERAIKSAEEEGKDKTFIKGIEMILQQFLDVLKKNGVEEIQTMGEAFDPNYHHAVLQEENENHESNTITDVFQKGYTLNGKVIRPSMVKVVS
ncbi:nucleotide exchange factor GrpE [Clostridiaceae bacterium 35-E11]